MQAGVFGAGKTRAAAAVIVGLIAIDPTLSIMICTKENAAAQAVAEHIVSMQLPDALLAKFGRLIGFHEAQKGASARTAIDVGSQNRNQVLRGKQVIIGCGGGFRHETAQKYSPILEWMAKIQLCLHDEAQQFGNLDEVAALARLPASYICIWTGDHKQTPGGLKKTPEAIAFRHKMMKRPIGLRCGTTLVQPHRLMELLPCIAETSPDTMARSIMTLSVAQARSRPGCINELQSVLHAQVDEEMLLCPVKRAALAVLWASYNVQESGLSVASSLGEAAGLEGRHQWGLILPSSFFFLIAGCNGSLGYWQSLATRESNKQHQWYCVPKESQVPIHYDLSHHNLCMTERMVHSEKRETTTQEKPKQENTSHQQKTNTHNQTENNRRHRGET